MSYSSSPNQNRSTLVRQGNDKVVTKLNPEMNPGDIIGDQTENTRETVGVVYSPERVL